VASQLLERVVGTKRGGRGRKKKEKKEKRKIYKKNQKNQNIILKMTCQSCLINIGWME